MSASVAALVLLTPYGTPWLDFEGGLRYQAAVILAATGALLVWGLGRAGWLRRWRSAPRGVLLGLGLYAAAALLGTVIGVLSGLPLGRVAGQALSMGLLPLAALAGLALEHPRSGHGGSPGKSGMAWLAQALALAVTGAAAVHLLEAAGRLLSGRPVGRLYFANSVSIAGPSLLALLLVLALLQRRTRWLQALWGLALVILGTYMLGSGIRGLLLVTPLAVLVALILTAPRLRWGRGLILLILLVLPLFAAERALWWWETAPRPDLMPGRDASHLLAETPKGDPLVPPGLALEAAPWTGGKFRRALSWKLPPEGEEWRLPQTVPVTEPGLYRLTAHLKSPFPAGGEVEDEGCVSLWWLDGERALLGLLSVCAEPGLGWREPSVTGLVPEGTVQARIVLHGRSSDRAPGGAPIPSPPVSSEARWSVHRLELERLGDAATGRLLEQLAFMADRLRSSLDPFSLGSQAMRGSAAYRLEESRTLIYCFLEAPWYRQLLGHGLGASYSLRSSNIVPLSSRLDAQDLNYIHNFYLFLLFKLGLAGTLAVLAALGLWIRWLGQSCLRTPPGPRRALLAALTAAWVGYALWSLASPEILNFRLAPIWGWTLALGVSLEPSREDEVTEASEEESP